MILAFSGCMEKEKKVYTILGDYTPYGGYYEKMDGRVKSVIEKNYWAVPEGASYIKGNPVTMKDRDTLNWTPDFEAVFDVAGDLVICRQMDETGKVISSWELIKENDVLTSARYVEDDTLRVYQKLRCNEVGDIIELEQYRAGADTLINKWNLKTSINKDTVEYFRTEPDGFSSRRAVSFFNKAGDMIGSENYSKEGELLGLDRIIYNEQGKMMDLTFYDKDMKTTAANYFTYEYDEMGNWIKTIVKDDRGLVIIGERQYTYHE